MLADAPIHMHKIGLVSVADGGGVRKVTSILAAQLQEYGLSVECASPNFNAPFYDSLPEGVYRFELASKKHPLILAYSLFRFLRTRNLDVVLCSQDQVIIVAAFLKRAGLVKIPLIGVVHNNVIVHFTSKRWLARLLPLLAGSAYRAMDHVVTVSKGLRDALIREKSLKSGSVTAIYNPIMGPREVDSGMVEEIRSVYGRFILGVGNFNEQKDFATLIESFSLIADSYPGSLVLLGGGEKHQELKWLAKRLGLQERISFPGFVDCVPEYLVAADCFVLSSRWEGFAIVVAEAIQYGCKVVSTDCDYGPGEILDGGRYGTLVPIRRPDQLAYAIEKSVQSDTDRQVLRDRAEAFSVQVATRRYLDLLNDLGVVRQ